MAEIQNPNQQGPGGGRDSNSLLLFSALFLVVFLGLQYFRSQGARKDAPAAQSQSQSQIQSQSQSQQQGPPQGGGQAGVAGSSAAAVEAGAEQPIVVETELYRVTFSNRGGQATSWILKKYKDDQGRPLDLVNRAGAQAYGYPLSIYSYDPGLRSRLAGALYVATVDGGSAPARVIGPATLKFVYAAGGLNVTKMFTFDATYVMHASVSVTQNGAPMNAQLAWPSGLGDQTTLPQYAGGMVDTELDGKAEQIAAKKVSGGATQQGRYGWAGVSDLYFAAVFLPDHPERAQLVTLHHTVDVARNPKKPTGETDKASVLGAAVGDTAGPLETRIFVGPKALGVLSAVHGADGGASLEKVVSFGWWAVVSKPLFLLLHWLHDHVVSNWGWAILILTLILNVIMLPTRVMMMRSSLKMQRIQPQMDAIKARYAKYKATDPKRQEMNKEVFDLQKREGVNMFGGCLPMLLQWPLLFGFYRMLSNVIELRQAHWLWLPDLASPDPLHILPIFFIISMFAVQYLTPSPGVDPQQQKMMAFTMPAVFGFMTWNIGSGLALYWACSNILGIVQQTVMNRTSLGREMRAIAAKRAAKKAGVSGKVINARR
ncbi:MAG TPA: membrane protein insertase YidC [Acidobacteriaceae bacterium]